jgi:hypothetical protein
MDKSKIKQKSKNISSKFNNIQTLKSEEKFQKTLNFLVRTKLKAKF